MFLLESSAHPQKYLDLGVVALLCSSQARTHRNMSTWGPLIFLVTGGGDEAEKKLTCRKTEAEDDLQESLPRPAVLLDGVVHGRIDAR